VNDRTHGERWKYVRHAITEANKDGRPEAGSFRNLLEYGGGVTGRDKIFSDDTAMKERKWRDRG
jgi:hypothetical protein